MEELALEASAILLAAGWSAVRVEQVGNGYLVAGTFQGQRHAGHTSIDANTSDDPRDMARRLVEIARGNAKTEPDDAGPVGSGPDPGGDAPPSDGLPDAPEPDDVAQASEAPPSGASSYPGVMLQSEIDQRRALLADAVQVEYRARLEPIAPRKGDLTAERVLLTGLAERTQEQMDRINQIDAEYNALMNRERDLSNWLAMMLAALIAKPAADLDTYDPGYGWP